MPRAKTAKTYRELSSELEIIILELQREDLDIDEALKNYERGLGIVQELTAYLKAAENKVTELQSQFAHDQ